ncbi:MAG: oligosaccharide flippase family protein [Sedimenticola sp.]|nr:oligosaccharide flippase family protein [Sedimenticola sp.]
MKSYNSVNRSFTKDTGVLAFGTIVSQLVIILSSPVLTRFYSPADFGMLAVYSAILGAVSPVISLRYDIAIVLPRSKQKANDLVILSLLIVTVFSLLSLVLIPVFDDEFVKAFGQDYGHIIPWLLFISILLVGTHQIAIFWAIRHKSYQAISGSKLSQSVFMVTVQLVCHRFGSIVLILGQIIGQIISTAYLLFMVCVRERRSIKASTCERLQSVASEYQKFPIYTTWSALVNSAGVQLPIMIFAIIFGIKVTGYYALAQRILTLPMAIVGDAIQSIFFTNISEEVRRDRVSHIISALFSLLIQLVLPPMLLVLLFAPEAFAYVFGDTWGYSGELAQLMVIWIITQFSTGPLTLVFAAMGYNKLDLFLQVTLFATRVFAIMVGIVLDDFYLTVAMFSIGSSVCYLMIFAMICKLSSLTILDVIRPFIKSLLYGVVIVSPLIYVKYVHYSMAILVITSVVSVALLSIWYIYLWNRYSSFKLEAGS